jgi:glycosyltransferase involved in cell wall biosynthesis
MKACVVTFKECWQDEAGRWLSFGGFPLQMEAVCSLFDEAILLVGTGKPRRGGIPLPAGARVIAIRQPAGQDTRRKLSVLTGLPYYIRSIVSAMRSADVVHVPLPGDIPLLGLLTALVLRKRVIARYCGSWTTTSRTTVMNRVTRMLMRRFAGNRNVMLATGDGVLPPFRKLHWIFASALSHHEVSRISPVLDRGLATPPRLVYAGRLSIEKGVAVLIDAVALLRAQGFEPLPTVTVLGDGPERDTLTARCMAAGCEGLFRFAGQVDRDDLSRELAQADLCVQPSLSEGFSKAWLDAMAHGLPVIASDVGAAGAAIGRDGERGWLLPAGDVAALASLMRTIISTPRDWTGLRHRCRNYVRERTLEAWAGRIGEICARQWGASIVEGKLRG